MDQAFSLHIPHKICMLFISLYHVSGPIKSFPATLTNTCLVSFPHSATVHTTTEEGLGTRLTAVYNVVMEYFYYSKVTSMGFNYDVTAQDLGHDPS